MHRPIVIMKNFKILFLNLKLNPKNNIIITELDLIINPMIPDVLNNNMRINETVNNTLSPDGTP